VIMSICKICREECKESNVYRGICITCNDEWCKFFWDWTRAGEKVGLIEPEPELWERFCLSRKSRNPSAQSLGSTPKASLPGQEKGTQPKAKQ